MEKKAKRKTARKRKPRKRGRERQWDESAEPGERESKGQGKDMAGGGWRGSCEEVLHGFDVHGKEKRTYGRNWSLLIRPLVQPLSRRILGGERGIR